MNMNRKGNWKGCASAVEKKQKKIIQRELLKKQF